MVATDIHCTPGEGPGEASVDYIIGNRSLISPEQS